MFSCLLVLVTPMHPTIPYPIYAILSCSSLFNPRRTNSILFSPILSYPVLGTMSYMVLLIVSRRFLSVLSCPMLSYPLGDACFIYPMLSYPIPPGCTLSCSVRLMLCYVILSYPTILYPILSYHVRSGISHHINLNRVDAMGAMRHR